MKTAMKPSGEGIKQEYDEWMKKLDHARDQIIKTHNWLSSAKMFQGLFGKDVHIIDLSKDE